MFVSHGAELIAAERERQATKEGFGSDHDDEHRNGELINAAIRYAFEGGRIGLAFSDYSDFPCLPM